MKISNKLSFILGLGLLGASQAYADNQITITGYVIDSTCTLTSNSPGTTNGGNGDIAVVLDSVPTTSFNGLDSTVGEKSFVLNLTKGDGVTACDTSTSAALKGITLSPVGAFDATKPSILINTTRPEEANRVNIQLLTDSNALVTYDNLANQAKSTVVLNNDLQATLTYKARYILSDETATTQNVQAAVTYTLQYN